MEEEKTLRDAVLCFLVREDEVLLAFKTEKIGKDCWNGYGGGIEPGESPEQAAVREVWEEARVVVRSEHLEKVAKIDFYNTKSDGSCFTCKVHVYLVRKWMGIPQDTKTMVNPTWFKKDRLPLKRMMPADKAWLPVVLSGKKITAWAHYGPFQKNLLGKTEIREVNFLPEK